MRGLFGAVLAVALAWGSAALANEQPYRIGECLWNALSPNARDEVFTAYAKGMNAATSALAKHDPEVQAAAAGCVGAGGAPKMFVQGAAGAAMIREVTARTLAKSRGIDAVALDRAWAESSEAARRCSRVSAARMFGPMAETVLNGQTCEDRRASLEPLTLLKLDPKVRDDRPAAEQATINFHARAQGELMEAMLTAFLRHGAPKR